MMGMSNGVDKARLSARWGGGVMVWNWRGSVRLPDRAAIGSIVGKRRKLLKSETLDYFSLLCFIDKNTLQLCPRKLIQLVCQ